jgi:hypothetical protein
MDFDGFVTAVSETGLICGMNDCYGCFGEGM